MAIARPRLREAFPGFFKTITFQIFLAPMALVIMERWLPEWWMFLLGGLGVFLAWFVAWWLLWIRQRRGAAFTFERIDGGEDPASILVVSASAPANQVLWERNRTLASDLIRAWQPSTLVVLASQESRQTHDDHGVIVGTGVDAVEKAVPAASIHPKGPALSVIPISRSEETDPVLLAMSVARHLRSSTNDDLPMKDTVIDVTGGTKPMSLALFDAARELGIRASYFQDSFGDGNDRGVRLLLDRPDSAGDGGI